MKNLQNYILQEFLYNAYSLVLRCKQRLRVGTQPSAKKCITWQPLSATAMNDLNGSLYYKLVVAFSFS